MKRGWKSLTAFALALVMCLTMLPVSVMAQPGEEARQSTAESAPEASAAPDAEASAPEDRVPGDPVSALPAPTVTCTYDAREKSYIIEWNGLEGDHNDPWTLYEVWYQDTADSAGEQIDSRTYRHLGGGRVNFDEDAIRRDYGPGVYTFRVKLRYTDGQGGQVESDWGKNTLTVDMPRLPRATDVHVTNDGTVTWRYTPFAGQSQNDYFAVCACEDGTHQPKMTEYVYLHEAVDGVYSCTMRDMFRADTTYRFAVKTMPGYGNEEWAVSPEAPAAETVRTAAEDTRLAAPENLSWDDDAQTLRWDPVSGAAGYRVEMYYPEDNHLRHSDYLVSDNAFPILSMKTWLLRRFSGKPATFYFTVSAQSSDLTQRVNSQPDHWLYIKQDSPTGDSRDELFHRTVTVQLPRCQPPTDCSACIEQGELPGIKVTWTVSPDADYYHVAAQKQNDLGEWVDLYDGYSGMDLLRLPLHILSNGSGTYRFRVCARSDNSQGSLKQDSEWASCELTYQAASAIAAPTGLAWDGDTNTLTWDAVAGAVSYQVLFWKKVGGDWSVDSFDWCEGTSFTFLPYIDGSFGFSVVSVPADVTACAPGVSDRFGDYPMQAFQVLTPRDLRFDRAAGMVSWTAAGEADGYELYLNSTDGSGRTYWCQVDGDVTSVPLTDFGLTADSFADGTGLELTIQAFIKRNDTWRYSESAELNITWSPALLDVFRDPADGLIHFGPITELKWSDTVPGVFSMHLGLPRGGVMLHVYNEAGERVLSRQWGSANRNGDDEWICEDLPAGIFDSRAVYDDAAEDWITVEGALPEGNYYATARFLGDGVTYPAEGPVVKSDLWHYTPAPADAKVDAPTDVSLQIESTPWSSNRQFVTRWRSTGDPARRMYYHVEILFAKNLTDTPQLVHSVWGFTDEVARMTSSRIGKNGPGVYYARVRAISSDVTSRRHSDWSEPAILDTRDPVTAAGDRMNVLNAGLTGQATAAEVRSQVQDAVKDLGAEKLEQAMVADQNDPQTAGVIETLKTLEAKAGGAAEAEIASDASRKIKDSFDAREVSVIGANLNKKEDAAQDVTLVIGDPAAAEPLAETCDAAMSVQFSMELQGVEDSHALAVPVQVTLPVPKVNPKFLHIIHYLTGGGREELEPRVFEENGRWYAQFVLTGLSDFAILVDKAQVIWTGGSGTLQVDLKVEQPAAEDGYLVLAAYDARGRMIDRSMVPFAAGESSAALSLTGAALTKPGVTAKVIWLDQNFLPLAEAMVYPTA